MPPAPATSEMLAEMSACAYRLGMAFGREAERAEAPERRLEMFQLFDRCFFALRVATALQLRLRRDGGMAPARAPASDAERLETERAEPDGPERERFEAERDRDRETERASLPVLLTTLRGVAADAAALPGPRPAELPALQDLLARVAAAPAPARPQPRAPALRDRLAGGSAALAMAAAPRRGDGAPDPAAVAPLRGSALAKGP